MSEGLTPAQGNTWLRRYMKKHPGLFVGVELPEAQAPSPARAALRAAARVVTDNGYASEAAFQAAAKARLEALGWHVQESLKGSARGGKVFYGKGWPDLQCYRPGSGRLMFFLELKQPGKIPEPAQLECHERLRAAGFAVMVAYTLEQCLNAAEVELNRT